MLSLGDGAAWRTEILTAMQVKALHLRNPLFAASEMSALMLMFDVMHVCDLGITGHVIANTLWTLVFQDMAGGNKHANFEVL